VHQAHHQVLYLKLLFHPPPAQAADPAKTARSVHLQPVKPGEPQVVSSIYHLSHYQNHPAAHPTQPAYLHQEKLVDLVVALPAHSYDKY
jgi:hypothetical protein